MAGGAAPWYRNLSLQIPIAINSSCLLSLGEYKLRISYWLTYPGLIPEGFFFGKIYFARNARDDTRIRDTPSDPISFCRGARVLALDARRAVDGRAKGGCARVAAFVRRDDAIHGALAGAAAPRPQHPGMERLGCHATDGKDAIRYARAAPSLHSLACCMVRPHAGIAGLAKLELFQTGGVAEDHRGAGHSCGHTHGH